MALKWTNVLSHSPLLLSAFSPAARPQSAQGGGGPDGGHAGRAAGRCNQLAPVSRGGPAEVGHHLSEGPLSHHHGHQRQAALRAHLR